jgi:hypothetical protein
VQLHLQQVIPAMLQGHRRLLELPNATSQSQPPWQSLWSHLLKGIRWDSASLKPASETISSVARLPYRRCAHVPRCTMGGVRVCKNFMPRAISRAIDSRSLQGNCANGMAEIEPSLSAIRIMRHRSGGSPVHSSRTIAKGLRATP